MDESGDERFGGVAERPVAEWYRRSLEHAIRIERRDVAGKPRFTRPALVAM